MTAHRTPPPGSAPADDDIVLEVDLDEWGL